MSASDKSKSPSSDNGRKSRKGSTPGSASGSKEKANLAKSSPNMPKKSKSERRPSGGGKSKEKVVTIDLTDPEDLLKKLEMIDFTDEEIEELLTEAQNLNKRLKKELERVEFEDLRKGFVRSFTISAAPGPSGRATLLSSDLEHQRQNSNSALPGPRPLPNRYASSSNMGGSLQPVPPSRSLGPIQMWKHPKFNADTEQNSMASGSRTKSGTKSSVKTKKPKERPEWNDSMR